MCVCVACTCVATVLVFVSLLEGMEIAITPHCVNGERETEREEEEECVIGKVLLTKEHHSAEMST